MRSERRCAAQDGLGAVHAAACTQRGRIAPLPRARRRAHRVHVVLALLGVGGKGEQRGADGGQRDGHVHLRGDGRRGAGWSSAGRGQARRGAEARQLQAGRPAQPARPGALPRPRTAGVERARCCSDTARTQDRKVRSLARKVLGSRRCGSVPSSGASPSRPSRPPAWPAPAMGRGGGRRREQMPVSARQDTAGRAGQGRAGAGLCTRAASVRAQAGGGRAAGALTLGHARAHGVGAHQAQRGRVAQQRVLRLRRRLPPPRLGVGQADGQGVAGAAHNSRAGESGRNARGQAGAHAVGSRLAG